MKKLVLSLSLVFIFAFSFALASCDRNDGGDSSVATTDMIVSQWNEVLNSPDYFSNATVEDRVVSKGLYFHVIGKYDLKSGVWATSSEYSVGNSPLEREERVYLKSSNEYYLVKKSGDEDWKKTASVADIYQTYNESFAEMIAPLDGSFDKFAYDSEDKTYKAESLSFMLSGERVTAYNVVVEFDSGKLKRISFKVIDKDTSVSTEYYTVFSDYGRTKVVVPDVAHGGSNTNDDQKLVALICLHGEYSTYDNSFIEGFLSTVEGKGLTSDQYEIVTDVEEGADCYLVASRLAEKGYKAIFADSYGHDGYMKEAAEEYPETQFYCASSTGTTVDHPENFHNVYAAIYEGRYLTGYAAGLKLNTMKDKAVNGNFKIGFVGAYTYAEVVSSYTAFYLGVCAALDEGYTATMEVQFTGAWYDEVGEKVAAETLIARGSVLISQYSDSMGAPTACDNAGIPNVAYNVDTGKSTLVAYSKINWAPYFEMILAAALGEGAAVDKDWTGTLGTGSVRYAIGGAAVEGTAEKVAPIEAELIAGTKKVFDCSNFKVGGERLNRYLADVIDDGMYLAETNAIMTENGITFFAESYFRSSPYFDVQIDGITWLNTWF